MDEENTTAAAASGRQHGGGGEGAEEGGSGSAAATVAKVDQFIGGLSLTRGEEELALIRQLNALFDKGRSDLAWKLFCKVVLRKDTKDAVQEVLVYLPQTDDWADAYLLPPPPPQVPSVVEPPTTVVAVKEEYDEEEEVEDHRTRVFKPVAVSVAPAARTAVLALPVPTAQDLARALKNRKHDRAPPAAGARRPQQQGNKNKKPRVS